MERLGLLDRRNDLVDTLSGGLRRRVEIAKALLHRPQVLLMDEASTGLDPAARRELSRHVETLREKDGVTILLTTHILAEAERCDRLVLLHQGKIVAQGSPRESALAHRRRRRGARNRRRRNARRRQSASAFGADAVRARRPGARRNRQRPSLHRRSGGGLSRARSIRWACTSPRWKTSLCTKRGHPLNSFISARGHPVAARNGALLAAEEPRAQRGGVAADLLAADRLRLQRPGALLLRDAGADGDVLRHLLHHLDHRRPPRRLSALHAGVARRRAPAWCWARSWGRPRWDGYRA